MADGTKIEWTDATWNIINGCEIVSKGCTNCYAMRLAGTRMRHHPSRAGLTQDSKAGPVWNGNVIFHEPVYDQPLRWRRPRLIFVCAHGDLFYKGVPDAWIDRVVAQILVCDWHKFQVLTKRPERMRDYFAGSWRDRVWAVIAASGLSLKSEIYLGVICGRGPIPNLWAGTSVEDQPSADERLPALCEIRDAALLWVSAEPLLGPIDFTQIGPPAEGCFDALAGGWFLIENGREYSMDGPKMRKISCIVAGGESGPVARPMHPAWARSIRDQCAAVGVAFDFKQFGEWAPIDPPTPADGEIHVDLTLDQIALRGDGSTNEAYYIDELDSVVLKRLGKAHAGRLLDGRTHDGMRELSR